MMLQLSFIVAMFFQGFLSPGPVNPAISKSMVEPLNKTKLLRLVNNLRTSGCKCGDTQYRPMAPLQWNDQLEAAAQAHSNDMEARKYFAHRSPEGNNAGYRLDTTGYKWKAFGENIGMGFRNEDEVVAAWKESPSHCKNMLNANFTEMGVARTGVYWTQTFGKR